MVNPRLSGQSTWTKPTESNLEASCCPLVEFHIAKSPKTKLKHTYRRWLIHVCFQLELYINSSHQKIYFPHFVQEEGPDDARSEVDKYLEDTATDLESLAAYPHTKKLYMLIL